MNTILRQSWLMAAVDMLKFDFWQIGETIPKLSVDLAWFGAPPCENTLGCCMAILEPDGSESSIRISVSPAIGLAMMVLEVLVHELVHATVGVAHGHDEEFCRVSAAIGLEDTGIHALAEEVLLERLSKIKQKLGAYPEIGAPA